MIIIIIIIIIIINYFELSFLALYFCMAFELKNVFYLIQNKMY